MERDIEYDSDDVELLGMMFIAGYAGRDYGRGGYGV